MKDHVFTLGIEEEFQIVKPEMHQSVVELGSEISNDASCARQQVIELRSELATLAARDGLKIALAGTHPFSHWMDQLITADERYATIVKDMQQIARAHLIFRLHVPALIPPRE